MKFELYKTYDITPYVPEVLGPKLIAVKVDGIMPYDQAKKLSNVNLYDLHNELLGKIDMLPENIRELTYILFKDASGRELILAQEYIDLFELSETELTDLIVRIRNTSTNMKQVINLRLLELGFKDFDIEIAHSV